MQLNKGLLKHQAKSFCQNRDIDWQKLDIESHIDSELTHEENWELIKERILESTSGIDESQLPAEDEIKKYEQEAREQYVEDVEEAKRQELKEEMEKDDPDGLKEYYRNFRNYVRAVAQEHHNALMVESPPGLGKSYQITKVLTNELGENGWVKHSGFSSPMEFYETLYEHRDKVLFLDDIEGLLGNRRALANLKQATWDESGTRTVEWKSSSSKLEAPQKFQFNGRIIMCFNDVPDGDPIVESLKSRTLFYDLDFTYEERLGIMAEIAKKDYDGMSLEERTMVLDWLVDHTEPETKELNLRTLFKCFELYKFNQNEWQDMAAELFDVDDEMAKVRELVRKYDESKKMVEEYKEATGKTRRTFYNKKKKLEKRSEQFEEIVSG